MRNESIRRRSVLALPLAAALAVASGQGAMAADIDSIHFLIPGGAEQWIENLAESTLRFVAIDVHHAGALEYVIHLVLDEAMTKRAGGTRYFPVFTKRSTRTACGVSGSSSIRCRTTPRDATGRTQPPHVEAAPPAL